MLSSDCVCRFFSVRELEVTLIVNVESGSTRAKVFAKYHLLIFLLRTLFIYIFKWRHEDTEKLSHFIANFYS